MKTQTLIPIFVSVLVGLVRCQIQPIINNDINPSNNNNFPISQPSFNQNTRTPTITDVTAMCAVEGVTAQIMFDGPFFGMIYSKDYATVHDCVYYNSYDMNMIMFTVPNRKCGTKITRNIANVVNRIENEVYVQFDKLTQTSRDRRFLFICELASASLDNDRSEVNNGLGGSETIAPLKQTVRINTENYNTIEPTRIVVTQTSLDQEAITMEIQQGRGPYQPPVSNSVKLGDLMTLVVKQDQRDTVANKFTMLVHSCYAADGGGQNKVQLVDRDGCTTRPQVAGRMQRTRNQDGDTLYYFRISAFKFPGPSDVYFTCSVDVCDDCDYPEPCARLGSNNEIFKRRRRNVLSGAESAREIQVFDYVRIQDDDARLMEAHARERFSSEEQVATKRARSMKWCLDAPALATIFSFLCTLLLVAILSIVYLMCMIRRSQHEKQNNTNHSVSSCSSTTTDNSQMTNPSTHRPFPMPTQNIQRNT